MVHNKLLKKVSTNINRNIRKPCILEVYFQKPVGIGEHPDLMTEIDKYIEKLETPHKLETLQRYFDEREIDTNKKLLKDK